MENRICQYCGKTYVYHGHKSGDHTKYCSDECFHVVKKEKGLQSYYRHGQEKQKARYRGDEKRTDWLKHSVPEGFTYLNDWEPGKENASFLCKKHGIVVTRNLTAIMRGPSGAIRCPECRREYLNSRSGTPRRKYGDWDTWKALLARRKKEAEEQIPIFTCKVCGKQFRSKRKNRKTCGGECSREYAFKRIQDDRIRQGCLVDKNITLKRLFNRDSGVCYLCGEMCDWNDKQLREDGVKIYGGRYPSIDHIIPLSKNGLHSWENVKLAHLRCNILKSDGVFPNLKSDGERLKKLGHPPKRTEQYTLDGLLIASYESAAEAGRQTGFKQKQIQNCARGEIKTYRGYIWRYA